MKHVMIDLETFGLIPGSAIRSIGACFFRPNARPDEADDAWLGETFYTNISRESCEAKGLTVDPNTEAWWARQSQEAQDRLLTDQMPLKEALWKFSAWFQQHSGEYVWSHGANFDQPLIEAAYRAVGMGPPWSHWNSRCTRTLFNMGQLDMKDIPRRGTHHDALEDAKHQALCAVVSCGRLFPPKPRIMPESDGSDPSAQ